MFKEIQERIYYLYQDKKQPLVLAIDEAQYPELYHPPGSQDDHEPEL
jgi:hypothetical protein